MLDMFILATWKDLPSLYNRVIMTWSTDRSTKTAAGGEMLFANISGDNWTFNGSLNLSRFEIGKVIWGKADQWGILLGSDTKYTIFCPENERMFFSKRDLVNRKFWISSSKHWFSGYNIVDGSEIPFPTTWDIYRNLVKKPTILNPASWISEPWINRFRWWKNRGNGCSGSMSTRWDVPDCLDCGVNPNQSEHTFVKPGGEAWPKLSTL